MEIPDSPENGDLTFHATLAKLTAIIRMAPGFIDLIARHCPRPPKQRLNGQLRG